MFFRTACLVGKAHYSEDLKNGSKEIQGPFMKFLQRKSKIKKR